MDAEGENLQKAIQVNLVARREAWNALCKKYKGKTSDELNEIWDKRFKKITENHYKNLDLFPNAFELDKKRNSLWVRRTHNKRQYFLRRMLGKSRTNISTAFPKDLPTHTLIGRLEDSANELLIRHNKLTPKQMKRMLAKCDQIINILYRRKDDIKAA